MGKKDGMQYLATANFRDKDNFDLAYNEGDDLSALSDERISELQDKGLVRVFNPSKAAQATTPAATDPAKPTTPKAPKATGTKGGKKGAAEAPATAPNEGADSDTGEGDNQ